MNITTNINTFVPMGVIPPTAPKTTAQLPSIQALIETYQKRPYSHQIPIQSLIQRLNQEPAELVSGYVATPQEKVDDQKLLLQVMQKNNEKYDSLVNEICDARGYGFIEKRDVDSMTKIIVRSDLHADLATLLVQLEFLKKDGVLDEEYTVRPGYQLVFTGDYMDRGANDFEVFTLLLLLRLQNADSVILLRGNHECVSINTTYNAQASFIHANLGIFETCYLTMPLEAAIAEKTGYLKPIPKGTHYVFREQVAQRQYELFVHGLPAIGLDIADFLAMPGSARKIVKENCKMEKPSLREIGKVYEAKEKLYGIFNKTRGASLETCTWGDPACDTVPSVDRPKISPEHLHTYFQAMATPEAKIRRITRGHSHNQASWHVRGKKLTKMVVQTLAVGAAGNLYEKAPTRPFTNNTQMMMYTVRPQHEAWDERPITVTKDENGLPTFHGTVA